MSVIQEANLLQGPIYSILSQRQTNTNPCFASTSIWQTKSQDKTKKIYYATLLRGNFPEKYSSKTTTYTTYITVTDVGTVYPNNTLKLLGRYVYGDNRLYKTSKGGSATYIAPNKLSNLGKDLFEAKGKLDPLWKSYVSNFLLQKHQVPDPYKAKPKFYNSDSDSNITVCVSPYIYYSS